MGFIKDILYNISNKKMLSTFSDQTIFPYYHIVRDDQVAHIENLYPYKNRNQFSNDIDLLIKNYKPLHPEDIVKNTTSKNGFLLSFDDGLEEVYSVIYPILKKYNIKAIFLLIPISLITTKGYINITLV